MKEETQTAFLKMKFGKTGFLLPGERTEKTTFSEKPAKKSEKIKESLEDTKWQKPDTISHENQVIKEATTSKKSPKMVGDVLIPPLKKIEKTTNFPQDFSKRRSSENKNQKEFRKNIYRKFLQSSMIADKKSRKELNQKEQSDRKALTSRRKQRESSQNGCR